MGVLPETGSGQDAKLQLAAPVAAVGQACFGAFEKELALWVVLKENDLSLGGRIRKHYFLYFHHSFFYYLSGFLF